MNGSKAIWLSCVAQSHRSGGNFPLHQKWKCNVKIIDGIFPLQEASACREYDVLILFSYFSFIRLVMARIERLKGG